MRRIILFIFVLAFIVSCKSRTTSVTCTDAPLLVFGLGFPLPDSAADVIKYKPDNAFDSLIDSVRIFNFDFDTVFKPNLQPITLLPGYDYKLVLPATANTWLLSKITYGKHFHEDMGNGTGNTCYNPVISYSLNGVLVAATDTNSTHSPGRLYIYK